MNKLLLCVLLTCVSYAWCKLSNGNKREHCDDCMPIWQCNAASQFLDMTNEKLQYINQFFCGVTDTFNICCSRLQAEHRNARLLPDSCGKIYNYVDNRVISGNEASLFEFPWMVLISHKNDNDLSFRCSGTLINSRYVLTAAHCVVNKIIAGVRVGEHTIGTETDCVGAGCESKYQDIQVEKEIPHTSFIKRISSNYVNDIALLRLAKMVDLSHNNVGTICLPTTKKLQTMTIDNEMATVVGWGRTQYGAYSTILLKVDVPIRSHEECINYHSFMYLPTINKICAGELNKDSCEGDSGGPLMLNGDYKGKYKVIQYGIVSVGPANCGSGTPALYTDVRKYINWILDNIED